MIPVGYFAVGVLFCIAIGTAIGAGHPFVGLALTVAWAGYIGWWTS